MLIISKAQMAQLGAHSRTDFVQRTVTFLKENTPQWTAERTDDVVADHIQKTIDACARMNIRQEINIQKVLYHAIRTNSDPFAEGPLRSALTTSGLTESRRVMGFIKYLREHGR